MIRSVQERIGIPDEHLKSIVIAIATANPELANKFISAIDPKPVSTRFDNKPGEIVGDRIAVNLGIEDSKSVLDCLINIEKTHGYNRKFGRYQINWLVTVWRDYVKLLEQSYTPKLPNDK